MDEPQTTTNNNGIIIIQVIYYLGRVKMVLELIDAAIAELEAKLNLPPGGSITFKDDSETSKSISKPSSNEPQKTKKDGEDGGGNNAKKEKKKKNENKGGKKNQNQAKKKNVGPNVDQPDICKLEFKVGQITKVWVHPDADKLYCEEIDCGEESPRQIASGLRPHYTLEQMQGQRLLVVSNLKVRNKYLLMYLYLSHREFLFVH